jgi:hypothetical protein
LVGLGLRHMTGENQSDYSCAREESLGLSRYELDGILTLPDKETGSHKKVTSEEGYRWNDSEFDDVAE